MKISSLISFTYKPLYILILASIALLCWFFDIFIIGISVYALIFVCLLIFSKDTAPIIPLIVLSTFMISKQAAYYDFSVILAIVLPIVSIAFGYYIIVRRPKLKKGKYFYGLLLAAIAMSVGGIGYDYNFLNVLSVAGISFAALFIYIFFNSTAEENLKKFLLNSFIAVTIILLLQIAIYYISADDFFITINYKTLNVGWGISNNIAFVLSMLLPVTFFMAITTKSKVFFIVLAFLQYIGILFTLSRGNIIFGGLAFAVFFIIALKISDKKLNIIFAASTVVATMILLCLIFSDISYSIFGRLLEMNIEDNGRIKLLNEAIESISINPVFGIGFFYKHALIPHWFHNSILQVAASTGIVGSLCYLVYFYQRYTIPFKNFNLCNFFMISSIILTGLYGLMECNFFFVYNMLFIIFIYIIIEREVETVNLFSEFFKKHKKEMN